MKLLSAIFVAFIATSSVAFGQSVASPSVQIPSELCGRWTTPDQRISQSWCAKNIDLATASARITVYSPKSTCTINSMPAEVSFDGTTLKISASDKKAEYMRCSTKFAAELIRAGSEWSGKIFGDADPRFDHLLTMVK